MKLGLIINPMAGIGGRVGLKGSDGEAIQQRARELGAVSRSGLRAQQALKALIPIHKHNTLKIFTCPGCMGEDTVRDAGFTPNIVGILSDDKATTREDTVYAAKSLKSIGLDLLLFAGGDGTARDVYDAVGQDFPVLGIPAGVKMQSAVYGITPEKSGAIALEFLTRHRIRLHHREVMDLDENALRKGIIAPKLYGYLNVPEARRYIQCRKAPTFAHESAVHTAIAMRMVNEMASDRLYIIGPGTTTQAIASAMDIAGTLIGVDIVKKGRLLIKDANESQILEIAKENLKCAVIVTLIGGQGFIFGRGNQQISPEVLRIVGADNIHIVATPQKINALNGRPILVDTGDSEMDKRLTGYLPVITGYNDRILYRAAR